MENRSDSESVIETIGEEFEENLRWKNHDDQTELICNTSSLAGHEDEGDEIILSPKRSSNSIELRPLRNTKNLHLPQQTRKRVSYSREGCGGIREVNFDGGTMNTWETIWDIAPPAVALCCTNFIEDEDPEWRDLDYGEDVGPPPESFCQFIMQYDFRVFSHEFSIGKGDMSQR